MIGLWFALTLVLGKAWCSYACFFGGIEEGFAAFAKRRRLHRFVAKYGSYSAARAVGHSGLSWCWFRRRFLSRFIACGCARSKRSPSFPRCATWRRAIQMGVFVALFVGLVVVLPYSDQEAHAVRILLPLRRISIAVQQDQSLRDSLRPREMRGLHALPDKLPDGGAVEGVGRTKERRC